MEENKFQIGDWVVNTTTDYYYDGKRKWLKLNEDHLIFKKEINGSEWEKNFAFVNKHKIWKPKVDEWCWFFNNKTDIPTLAKLIEITTLFDRNKTYIVKTPSCISETSYNYSRTMNFKYCEPFIGELPSFIKE